jgi:hypothetical protein
MKYKQQKTEEKATRQKKKRKENYMNFVPYINKT